MIYAQTEYILRQIEKKNRTIITHTLTKIRCLIRSKASLIHEFLIESLANQFQCISTLLSASRQISTGPRVCASAPLNKFSLIISHSNDF